MSTLAFKCLMETNKLTGSNFADWLRNLRLVLRLDKVEYVLDTPISVIPDKESPEYASFDEEAHAKHVEHATSAQCIMLWSMSNELQRQHEHMFPYEMLQHLKSLYASQTQTMEYEILQDLFKCRLHDGGQVSEHVLKMIGLIERLASIGTVLPANVSTNLILQSLPSCFENFIVNFNMNNTKAGLPELHNMLKTYQTSTSKGKSVLMVGSSASSSKRKNQQKKKKKASKDAVLKPKSGGAKKKPTQPKDECLFCHEKGHWKRDCPKFKAHGAMSGSSGMFVIEINMSMNNSQSWVLDTACGSHICNNVQGLSDSRKVRPGEVDLRVGNGARVAAERVGTYRLDLPRDID